MPVWHRSLHDTYGWFDEARYGTYADWAFWLNVLRNSQFGWINPNPLGFYFVNPTSHNRRGTALERLHKVVEDDFIDIFKAKRSQQPHTALPLPHVPRKLRLSGRGQAFGQHRNDFNRLIHALDPLERHDDGGVFFMPFLERYFVWGRDPGEARSENPEPLSRDWIGILHVPFDAPEWFDPDISPEAFLDTDLWHGSRHTCRGVLTLSADLAADLKAWDPDLNVLAVRHPVELNVHQFDPAAFHARPRVVQAGDWLRKLQAIHRLKAPGYERVMLLKTNTEKYLEREMAIFGDQRDPGVDMRKAVPNDEYDAILSSSVMLCLMYATAANNLVIECIARGTPILVNPLPSTVEYLGPDYPLYVSDEAEASRLLEAPELIDQAHRYLLARRLEIDLSYDGFCRDIARSEWYTAL